MIDSPRHFAEDEIEGKIKTRIDTGKIIVEDS